MLVRLINWFRELPRIREELEDAQARQVGAATYARSLKAALIRTEADRDFYEARAWKMMDERNEALRALKAVEDVVTQQREEILDYKRHLQE